MKLMSYGADGLKELLAFANEKDLKPKDIVAILNQVPGSYILVYYGE